MLSIVNLTRQFKDWQVLRGISVQLQPGEYVAIVGELGVGKSTLLNLIAGLDRPDGGGWRSMGWSIRGWMRMR